MPAAAKRLLAEPIIYPHMDGRMGDNITGPSLIRVPDWVERRLGRYYLYFADHKGKYIRLAYADELLGPWTMYEPGALDLSQSLYPAEDPPEPPEELRPPWAKKMVGGYLYAHIASPDVHIDAETRQFRMYFHGLLPNGDQATRVAYSSNGLAFVPKQPLLGSPYFRVFSYEGWHYTLTWGGNIWRSREWDAPFEKGPQILPYADKEGVGDGVRHSETFLRGDILHIFYHRMGDCPEAVLHAEMKLAGDWENWTASPPTVLLEPELTWEGADLPLEPSVMGAVDRRVRQLRDPAIFEDVDGSLYMLYCGAGESGIGITSLELT